MRAATHDGRKVRVFWSAAILALLVDVLTKALAHTLLVRHHSFALIGDLLQLTLAYNPGAAFGLHLGPYSRWVFLLIAAVALLFLWRMYREADAGDRLRALALGLVAGGAAGNLVNRIWSSAGVVDFLDVGLGETRWPTFNFADVAISVGACLLAWALWGEDQRGPDEGPRLVADLPRSMG